MTDLGASHQEFISVLASFTRAPTVENGALNDAAERTALNILTKYPDLCKATYRSQDGILLPLHFAILHRAPFAVLQRIVACYPEALETKETEHGATPLNVACVMMGNDVFGPEVFELLSTPEAVRTPDRTGTLPLHNYCRGVLDRVIMVQVIRLLVDVYPESLQEKDSDGMTPLAWACLNMNADSLAAIRLLIELCPEALRFDNQNGTPLQFLVDRSDGSLIGHLPVIRTIIEACPELASQVDARGCSLLHRACFGGHATDEDLPAFKFLIEACSQSLSQLDRYGTTPLLRLCEAAGDDALQIFHLLVKACPQALTIKAKGMTGRCSCKHQEGDTPLHVACCGYRDNVEVIRFLAQHSQEILEPADDSRAPTPLHVKCHYFCDDGTDGERFRILSISEKAVTAKDRDGRTPLHIMAHYSWNPEYCQELVAKCPALSQMKDDKGQLPLHVAVEAWAQIMHTCARWKVENGDFDRIVSYLLTLFPGGVYVADNDGNTPLELACEKDVSLSLIYQLVCVDPVAVLGLATGT